MISLCLEVENPMISHIQLKAQIDYRSQKAILILRVERVSLSNTDFQPSGTPSHLKLS